MSSISALLVVQNEAHNLRKVLPCLRFCDEVVVINGGSEDETTEVALAAGARVICHPFVNMNTQKDFGRRNCQSEWVLVIDADERVSSKLAKEVSKLVQNNDDSISAYNIPFRTYFGGVLLRHGGFGREYHIRLFRKNSARYDESAPVHDRVCVVGRVGRLAERIDHYSFDNMDAYLQKSQRYARAFAQHAYSARRRVGIIEVMTRSFWRFFRTYVIYGGFRDGRIGFLVAGLQAMEVFQKYTRIWELQGLTSIDSTKRPRKEEGSYPRGAVG